MLQASSSAASSVERRGPSAGSGRCAARQQVPRGRPAASGRPPARRGRRSRRPRRRRSASASRRRARPGSPRRASQRPRRRPSTSAGRRAAAPRRGRGRPGLVAAVPRRARRSPPRPILAPRRRRRRRAHRRSRGSHGAPASSATRSAAVTTTIRPTRGAAASASSVQAQQRPARRSARASLSTPPIRARRARRRRRSTSASRRGRAPAGRAQSSRGWAKIIRPATVWRTRVTVTSSSRVDVAGAALDHDHRAVVEEADALAGLLALLDDPDPQLLAGQDRGLHGVGQRVDVHHPDALQLGDAVEVEVVGQDRPGCGAAPARRAWRRPRSTSGTSSSTISTGVRGSFCIRPRIVEAAPAAVAAQRVASCRRCAGARRARTAGTTSVP